MIRINLLGEKVDKSAAYTLQLLALAAALTLTVATCFFWHARSLQAFDSLKGEKNILDIKLAKLREQTVKVDNLTEKKKRLEEKRNALRLLKANKTIPVRVLDEVTKSIPVEAWMVSLKENGGMLEFEGVALDNQTISKLMDRLEQSRYFADVGLGVTKQYERDGVPLKQFTLSARLENPLAIVSQTDGANAQKPEQKTAS